MNDIEYWNSVAHEAFGDNIYTDNFLKRRLLVRNLLKYDFRKTKILEIGTGLGTTIAALMILHGFHIKYTGTDISPVFCENARKLFKLKMVNTRASNLPFEDKSFDVLFAFDVLEHIPYEERDAVYKEIGRVLDDDGYIFINNPHIGNVSLHDPMFDYIFSDNDLIKLCKATNKSILEFTTYEGYPGVRYQFIVLGAAK